MEFYFFMFQDLVFPNLGITVGGSMVEVGGVPNDVGVAWRT